MSRNLILSILTLLICAPSARGEMARVTSVVDGRTLTVERRGRPETLRLAGVEVLDELRARELLRWTVGSSWVMIEPSGSAWKVWRSPDALFVNEELVLRGFAKATLAGIAAPPQAMVTYLGILDLPAKPTAKPAAKPVVRPARESRSGTGTSRRSPGSRSPGERPRRRGAAGQ